MTVIVNGQEVHIQVRASYPGDQYPGKDQALYEAVGRTSDFSGMSLNRGECKERDHGWVCKSPEESQRIVAALEKWGCKVTVDVE